MRLKLQLPAKAGPFRISECEATRLLTLSTNDFQSFLNWPQKEKCRGIQPSYYEEDGKRVYRGVLILGEGHEDGVFSYDAGEHFAYLPGARAVVDSILEQAVERIIREGTENTNEGSWCYYFSELYEQMGLLIEEGNGFDTLLLEKLEQRPEAAEVTLTDECFDICYYLDYCRNLSDEEMEIIIPLARQSELFRKSVSVFCDMYDEESGLYEMLHNNLGMSDSEIRGMGLNMRTSCIEIHGKDIAGWYITPQIRSVADIAAMLAKVTADVEENALGLPAIEAYLGEEQRSITEKEFEARRNQFFDSEEPGTLVKLDFEDDHCAVFTRAAQSGDITVASGMISRLAGIYEQAQDHATGSIDQDLFISGLYQHFGLYKMEPLDESMEQIDDMTMQ